MTLKELIDVVDADRQGVHTIELCGNDWNTFDSIRSDSVLLDMLHDREVEEIGASGIDALRVSVKF